MPLGPITSGRLPGSLLALRLQHDLQRSGNLLAKLQDQVATGHKLFLPSDQPTAAIRSILLQRQIERQEQWEVSIQTNRSFLSASEQSLQTVSDLLNHAKSLLLSGVGDTVSSTERLALADEVGAAIQGAAAAANATHGGRYLFGGSETQRPPFQILEGNTVAYQGDRLSIETLIDQHLLASNNLDGAAAFGVLSPVPATDVNPALSLDTRLSDLHQGAGVALGSLVITLDDGTTVQQATVDLSSAQTIEDVQARLQAAFASGPLTLTVDVDPGTNFGLRLTPSAGSVAVADLAGSTVAQELGIASAPAASISGADLNPRLTERTRLADLNSGTGIGLVTGTGLQLTLGDEVHTIDLAGAATVEDLFNSIRQSGLALHLGINSQGTALEISSRISGVNFSIGENNGDNATRLGIRTLNATTPLSTLNGGLGVPLAAGTPLEITRRDGTTIEVDLTGASSVQDVLNAVNAVDPGVLVASLNLTGNGISIVDQAGTSTGPLVIAENAVSVALGLNGSEDGTNPAVALVGRDVNPQESEGLFNVLSRLEQALRNGDDRELERLDGLLDRETERFHSVRGEIGSRLQQLDQVEGRLKDREVLLQQSLSLEFDTDITETITQVAQVQTALEATLRIAAQTSQLTLLSFL